MRKKNDSLIRAVLPALVAVALTFGCGGDDPDKLVASAKDYIAKNDSKAAVIQLKNALQSRPDFAEARYLLGSALLASGDAAGAEVELRKALELKHASDLILPALARSLLAQGQFKKIIDEFAKAEVGSAAAKADLQTTIGQANLGLGKVDAAKTAFAAALATQADYAPALIGQARLTAGGGDLPAAAALVDSVLAKSPKNHEAWQLKGDILRAQGQAEPALVAYRKALEIKSDYLPAHTAIASRLIQEGRFEDAAKQIEALQKIAPKNPQTSYLQAQLAYRQKNFTAAREAIQQMFKFSPDAPQGLQLAGAIEYELKSYVQAEAYLTKALQRSPDLDLARRVLIVTYLSSRQPAKALAALQPILDKIDKNSDLLALAGQVYMQNGDPRKAEEYFAKAAALDPQSTGKRTSLALTHLMKGETDTAFRELEEVAAADAGTTADMALIAAHVRRNEFDKALKAIDGLEKKEPKSPVPHGIRGGVLLAKKDLAGARKSYEQALVLDPLYFPAAASLASLDVADKKPEAAKKRFENILAKDPKNLQALLAMAELVARTGGSADEVAGLIGKAISANPTELTPRLALISHYRAAKDTKKAVSAAQDALAALPDRPELLEAAATVLGEAGDTNQALAMYGKLATLQPNSPRIYLRIAELQIAAKNKDAAMQSLRKALAIKPDMVEAQRGIIMLDLDAGRIKEAIAMAREIQKQRPKEPPGYVLEGDVHLSQKAFAEAASVYRNGLKQAPSSELATKLYGALLAGGNRAEADKHAETWLKEHPKDGTFRLYLAEVANARGDYAASAKHYQVLLEAQPNNPLVLNNLAWAAHQRKDPKALEYAEKANKLAPNNPAIMDTLGVVLADKGDTARGLELLQKAVAAAPQAPAIRLNLAKVQIKAGQKAAARKELDELAKLGDKFPAQAEVSQLIKGL